MIYRFLMKQTHHQYQFPVSWNFLYLQRICDRCLGSDGTGEKQPVTAFSALNQPLSQDQRRGRRFSQNFDKPAEIFLLDPAGFLCFTGGGFQDFQLLLQNGIGARETFLLNQRGNNVFKDPGFRERSLSEKADGAG